MGSCSSPSAGACARLRRDAKAGGVARACSTRARTYAESWGPSAMRPPVTASAAATLGCAFRLLPPAAVAHGRCEHVREGDVHLRRVGGCCFGPRPALGVTS
eukprot:6191418-Pleurochrysis_carterae.AAC.1